MTQHIVSPREPHTEPQRRWLLQTESTVGRYLDGLYGDREADSRALDGLFIHIAADVIAWLAPAAPGWHLLDVDELVMQLVDAPHWDDTWLLHAVASVSAFYRWLGSEGAIEPRALAAIQDQLDHHLVTAMTNLGLSPHPHPDEAN